MPSAIKDEKPGLVSGKLILLALLITVVLMPLPVWLTLRWVRGDLAIGEPPLVYAERASWPTPPVKHTTMEVPISNYVPSGAQPKWRTVELDLLPGEEQAVRRCAELAAGESFADAATGNELRRITEQHPQLWYPRWLLGKWHELAGDTAESDRCFSQAFAAAPATLIVPFVDGDREPLADFNPGAFVIACDRADGESIDQSLKLVYPATRTDSTGQVYLPVYHTVLRFAELPTPDGYQIGYGSYQWFEFPGRIAALRPAVVWPNTAAAGAN